MELRETGKSQTAKVSGPVFQRLYRDGVGQERPGEPYRRSWSFKSLQSAYTNGRKALGATGIEIDHFPNDPGTLTRWLSGETRIQPRFRKGVIAAFYGIEAARSDLETELHRAWRDDDAAIRPRRASTRGPANGANRDNAAPGAGPSGDGGGADRGSAEAGMADPSLGQGRAAALASALAKDFVDAAASGSDATGATAELLHALGGIFEPAIEEAIGGTRLEALAPDDRTVEQAQKVLVRIFSNCAVAETLVHSLLSTDCDPQSLASLASSAGLDPAGFPFRWSQFLSRLLAALEETASAVSSISDSPLAGRFSAVDFFQLRAGVALIDEGVESVVGRWTQGLADIDPASRQADFFFNYLGRSGRPKPFGGRAHEIRLLNEWLRQPDDRPRLLLTAPAGKGKSALLVHWARQLPPDIAVVFVPVSLRFETAQPEHFLPALARRLMSVYGQLPDTSLFKNIESARLIPASLVRRALSSHRHLVIVIDGLDEAGLHYSWAGLFPQDLASNVRIVVAARQLAGDGDGRDWMARLGWDTVEQHVRPLRLEGLSIKGVRQVLRGLALPAPYTSAEMVDVLFHLTEGDPLLVGLYAEQLFDQSQDAIDAPWTIEDLRSASPGIESFFERWLADQERLWGGSHPLEETRVRGCLAILAHALGPIRAAELRTMMSLAYGVGDWTLRTTLEVLARFVIGDGRNHGFSLTHPRLTEFFSSESFIGADERDRVRNSFLRWGRETLDALDAGTLRPEGTPPYLLAHLSDHLVQAGSTLSTLMRLLGPAWIRSWEIADPTYRGFLGDVQRAWDVAREISLNPAATAEFAGLGEQVRCLLRSGSIQSPHQPIPVEILIGALETRQLSPAQVLSVLAYDVDRSFFHERIEKMAHTLAAPCGQALADLADIKQYALFGKVRALARIAEKLRGIDRILVLDKAKRAIRECDDVFDQIAGAALLVRFSRRGQQGEARRIAESMRGFDGRRIQSDVIMALAGASRDLAAGFASACVTRGLVLSAFELEPAMRDVFALLPQGKQAEFIDTALGYLGANPNGDHRDFITVIEPFLSDQQRSALAGRIRELGPSEQIIVFSRFDRIDEQDMAQLFEHLVETLGTKSGSLGALSAVQWRRLFPQLGTAERDRLNAALLHEVKLPMGSGQWLDLVCEILPWLSRTERMAAIAAALDHARQHFDQVPTLVTLGKAVQFLPPGDQSQANERLWNRVRAYVDERPMLADPRRIQLALELLDFMDEPMAATLSNTLFDAKKAESHVSILTLTKVVHFLDQPRRDEAELQIRAWARDIEWSSGELSGLRAAQQWLPAPEFQAAVARFYEAAASDGDGVYRARNLSAFLPWLEERPRDELVDRLLEMAVAVYPWEHGWSQVLKAIITDRDAPWLLEKLYPFLAGLALRAPEQAARLSVRVAARVPPAQRAHLIEQALDWYPLSRWPVETIVELVPFIADEHRILLISEILRELSTERRVRQFAVLEELFPALADLGQGRVMREIWEAIWETTLLWP